MNNQDELLAPLRKAVEASDEAIKRFENTEQEKLRELEIQIGLLNIARKSISSGTFSDFKKLCICSRTTFSVICDAHAFCACPLASDFVRDTYFRVTRDFIEVSKSSEFQASLKDCLKKICTSEPSVNCENARNYFKSINLRNSLAELLLQEGFIAVIQTIESKLLKTAGTASVLQPQLEFQVAGSAILWLRSRIAMLLVELQNLEHGPVDEAILKHEELFARACDAAETVEYLFSYCGNSSEKPNPDFVEPFHTPHAVPEVFSYFKKISTWLTGQVASKHSADKNFEVLRKHTAYLYKYVSFLEKALEFRQWLRLKKEPMEPIPVLITREQNPDRFVAINLHIGGFSVSKSKVGWQEKLLGMLQELDHRMYERLDTPSIGHPIPADFSTFRDWFDGDAVELPERFRNVYRVRIKK